jgi:hypothetical protein
LTAFFASAGTAVMPVARMAHVPTIKLLREIGSIYHPYLSFDFAEV